MKVKVLLTGAGAAWCLVVFIKSIEKPKIEYSILQAHSEYESEEWKTSPHLSSESHGYWVVGLRGHSGGKISILLNPKCQPYYKQIPPEANFSIKRGDLEAISKMQLVNETVLSSLRSHLISE